MKITDCRFIKSAVSVSGYPDTRLPEFSFIGRSNVGKSSLLNYLVGRKKMARTSSKPGKTQTLNFFMVNEQYVLVDLPGYGFTNAPVRENIKWRRAVGEYFSERAGKHTVFLLIDSRHPELELDRQVFSWLWREALLCAIIATKSDKLGKGRLSANVGKLRRFLGVTDEVPVIPTSIKTKDGKHAIWRLIGDRSRMGSID